MKVKINSTNSCCNCVKIMMADSYHDENLPFRANIKRVWVVFLAIQANISITQDIYWKEPLFSMSGKNVFYVGPHLHVSMYRQSGLTKNGTQNMKFSFCCIMHANIHMHMVSSHHVQLK